jgi:hypothetical protein
MKHGYLPYTVDSATQSWRMYTISFPGDPAETPVLFDIGSNTITHRWAIKDIPALSGQNFTTSLKNYGARLDFQLRRIKSSKADMREYMGNWEQLANRLMAEDNFGVELNHPNGWLNSDIAKITDGAATGVEKAQRWYNYVRDNFTWNGKQDIYLSKTLKQTFTDKNGNAADLNLLLLAGLLNLHLESYPAILSTRDNGKASEMYPIINQYNYVICCAKIDGRQYNLDATDKMLGFGKLPERVFNESARLLEDTTTLISLSADSLKESKITTLSITDNEDGKPMAASFASVLGQYESLGLRRKLAKQTPEDFFKDLKTKFSFQTDITGAEIDSLKNLEVPLTVKYNFTLPLDNDIIYLNPMLNEGYKENPFKSIERLYPVEMPYCMDELYVLNMDIPNGYKVEELPKSTRFKLNDNDGMFEYIIAQGNGKIQLRCRLKLNKANFETEDYEALRNFFASVVQKQAEQVVLKKI